MIDARNPRKKDTKTTSVTLTLIARAFSRAGPGLTASRLTGLLHDLLQAVVVYRLFTMLDVAPVEERLYHFRFFSAEAAGGRVRWHPLCAACARGPHSAAPSLEWQQG